MVVVHHACNPSPDLWNPLDGYHGFASGVDIFFVVSGFIMIVSASTDRPGRFMAKRVIRIVPLYWVATFIFLILHRRTAILSTPLEQWRDVLLSLLFVPHYSSTDPGEIYPYLVPGWTLNLEMFFYVLFAAGLAVRRPALVTAVAITTLSLCGLLLSPSGAIPVSYTSPRLLEFLAGVAIGQLYRRGALGSPWLSPLIPFGFVMLLLPHFGDGQGIWIARVVGASAIVLGTVAVDDRTPYLRCPALMGDASYSIYLTHTILAIPVVTLVSERIPDTWPRCLPITIHVLLALIAAGLVGVAAYRLVERPTLRWLREKWLAPAAVGSPGYQRRSPDGS